MKFNLDENAKFVQALSPASYSSGAEAFTSPGVDCQGFDELLVFVDAGVIGGTIAIRVQEAAVDSGASYADVVTAANGFASTILVSTNTALPGFVYGRIDLAKRLRYIRFGYTVGSSSAIFGIGCILSNEKYRPLQSGQGEAGYPVAGATAAGRCFQV